MGIDSENLICPYCGKLHHKDMMYCPATGKQIIIKKPKQIDLCPQCGAELQIGWNNCIKCGYHIIQTKTAINNKELISKYSKTSQTLVKKIFWFLLPIIGITLIVIGIVNLIKSNSKYDFQHIEIINILEEKLNGLDTVQQNKQATIQTNTDEISEQVNSTKANIFTQTPTKKPTSTNTSKPTESPLKIYVNPKDSAELVYIPEGEFIMGADTDSPYFWGAEAPEHYVYLDDYWIYRTEVTNAMYATCVADKACPAVQQVRSRTRGEYFGVARFDDYPVIYVTWTHAQAYCVWAGGKLPTEAQWEKAARGTDGRMFPWGNDPLTENRANFCDKQCTGSERDPSQNDGYADTAPIGSFPDGASQYGVLDMAGNVWEWCLDNFLPGYYSSSPYENPLGPTSSKYRVVRGGGFDKISDGVRTAMRYGIRPDISLETVGFRCAFPNDSIDIK